MQLTLLVANGPQVGINIRSVKHGCGFAGRGWGEKYFGVAVARHLGVDVATYGSYKTPLATRHRHLPCLGDVYGVMTTASFRSWLPNWCPPEMPFS